MRWMCVVEKGTRGRPGGAAVMACGNNGGGWQRAAAGGKGGPRKRRWRKGGDGGMGSGRPHATANARSETQHAAACTEALRAANEVGRSRPQKISQSH